MAYNASLANFLETQGVPYAGSPVTNDQVVSYLQANPGMTDAQIASAMNQYGVSPAQMAQATGVGLQDVQSRYNAATAQNQGIQSLINQAYGSVGVTSPDQPGAQYWASQLQSGAIKPEDFQRSFLTAATGVTDPTYAANVAKAQELLGGLNTQAVTKAYQDVLGRAGDTAGTEYFIQQLASGALKPQDLASTLAQAAIPIATTLEDRLALQKYLGQDIYAPEEFLRGTSGYGYQDIVDYINANVQDPVKIAQAAARYGIDPAEILAAKQAVGGQDIPTIKAIEDYLSQGRAGLGTRISNIVSSTIGSSAGPNDTTITPEERLAILQGSLSTADRSKFTAETFANKSIEEIENIIRSSPENRLDKADEVSRFLTNLYGTPVADATNIRTSLFQNKDTDDKAEKLYNAFIKGTANRDLINSFYIDAAKTNPASPYFTKNPGELIKYTPIDKIVASPKDSGQYQYYKDAPMLSAKVAEDVLPEGAVYVGGNNYFGYGPGTDRDDALGWDLRSKYLGSIAKGAGVFGVRANENQINEFDRIQKKIDQLGGVKDGYVSVPQTDPETGRKFMANVPVSELFATSTYEDGGSNGGENYKLYQDTLNALNQGAQQLGLNPASFKNPSSLFNAVNDKAKHLYVVTGRANNWDEDVAQRAGITGVGRDRGGINHAQVLYEKVGDKLVPLKTLKTFNFDDPNTTRGFLGDLAQDIASIPFVAEASLLLPGVGPGTYAAIKGAQTLALGGNIEDAIKAGGLAYLASNFIPKTLSPQIQGAISSNPLVQNLAQIGLESGSTIGADLANFVTKAGSNAIISSGIASLTGQDPLDAATKALISSGVFQTTKAGLEFTDAIPDKYRNVVANIITSTVLGQDPSKSLTGAATQILGTELKDVIKTREVLKDERTPTIQV